jgi:hypothetical protein
MDYKNAFEKKLFYIISMTKTFGLFRVPLDWFNVGVETKSATQERAFRLQSLLEMYAEETKKYLTENNIELTKNKKEYAFTNKPL